MAKHIIVKKTRKVRWSGLIGSIFALSLCFTFVTQIFVKTTNQHLATNIQKIEAEIMNVQTANESVTVSIQQLRDATRIVGIANEAGLQASKNTVTIKGE
ncbi:cell division protein FtsL [Erysipelothrix sp. D19-032]|uniref:cell division protein FtsL n=1 Tax=Erysipelothrix aquatica TaxID=2683714 RepID=UPI00135B529D|nr:cell division protein FtsL [Erysipelothrix aquatica]